MIKAIAFDLGGCLLKENDVKMSSCEELLEKQFGNINFDDEYFSWACQFFSLSEGEVRSILLNLFPKLYLLRDLLIFEKILKRHPKITFAIASNHISLVRESLYALGILDKFEVILISGDCGYEKPYKKFYELLGKKLGLSMEEILLVDDAEENIQGAKNLGYKTLLYQRGKSLSESIISFLQTINYL